ncbi:hypothetical protein MP638_004378 [Amoeboaphelidium occidentale]|nr:hypothetical protein MP638_004378 [Amoeboaphelidium occidentale]
MIKKAEQKSDENVKMSSKKRKRLEKYIERKLKKEERVNLLEKLAESSVDSNLLRSSRTLGNGKQTAKERVKRAFELEKAGMLEEDAYAELYDDIHVADGQDVSDDGSDHDAALPVVTETPAPKVQPQIKKAKVIEEVVLLKSETIPKPDDKPLVDSHAVVINRDPTIEEQRRLLPILGEEHNIIDMIKSNDVVILTSSTGSGKTTQMPQILFEHGFGSSRSEYSGMIAITQPRRVAAMSTSKRVAFEMNDKSGVVSYHVRYDNQITKNTIIKFMTDGILLEEVGKDFLLSKYSCIIIDEAHERSLNTDILIGLLSRIVKFRNAKENRDKHKPLKLIIMSATLKVEEFSQNPDLFKAEPPIFNVESRRFPVTVHFNRKTPDNYLEAAFKKVWKIHTTLPAGAILVFLTGKNEILWLMDKLNEMSKNEIELKHDDYDEEEETENKSTLVTEEKPETLTLVPIPLYASLSAEDQFKAFQTAKPGQRICIIATNVAETSITIPDVKYVIDSGKEKQKCYDASNSISVFNVEWISKSSAEQRCGRAGRTSAGHCYRLYSSSVFQNEFPEFSKPEMVRMPMDDVYLRMKSMEIDNIINFPFPTKPEKINLVAAERLLKRLGALNSDRKMTEIGRYMSAVPINSRLSRILYYASSTTVYMHAVALVATLSSGEVFESGKESVRTTVKDVSDNNVSDCFKYVVAFGAYMASLDKKQFCEENCIVRKSMEEAVQLYYQLCDMLKIENYKNLNPLSQENAFILAKCLMSGFIDQVAVYDKNSKSYQLAMHDMYGCAIQDVFIHPDSVFFKKGNPEVVVFQELRQSPSRLNMRNLTIVSDRRLLGHMGESLCTFSPPLETPSPKYNAKEGTIYCSVKPFYGDLRLELPPIITKFKSNPIQARWFGRFLLEGQIFKGFEKYKNELQPHSSVLTKINFTNSKIIGIVQPLLEKKIETKQQLQAAWNENPNFMLNAYLSWLPAKLHNQVRNEWKTTIKN